MSKIIIHAGNEFDVSEPIHNLLEFSTALKAKGSPELSDMVINVWSRAHAMRYYLMETDEKASYERLLKMAKFLQPLLTEIVSQVGNIKTDNPNNYCRALEALDKIIAEAPLEVNDE